MAADVASRTEKAKAAAADVADKSQSALGPINDRAKMAMEKGAAIGQEVTDLTRGNVEAIVTSGRAAAQGAQVLARCAADYGQKSLETTAETARKLAGIKSPSELVELQGEYLRATFNNAVEEAARFSESWIDIASSIVRPISRRYAAAADRIRTVILA